MTGSTPPGDRTRAAALTRRRGNLGHRGKPMARRYTRDNRGRFASVGATARGGRLRTAAGNKRATVTMKAAKRATPSGSIRASDVSKARISNAVSKHVERRQSLGLSPVGGRFQAENQSARLRRAEKSVEARRGKQLGKAVPKAKLPREQRLARAQATATRIAKTRQARADATREEFMNRRRISSRAARKGKWSAYQKEEAAGAASAKAMRSWQGAEKRVDALRSATPRRRKP